VRICCTSGITETTIHRAIKVRPYNNWQVSDIRQCYSPEQLSRDQAGGIMITANDAFKWLANTYNSNKNIVRQQHVKSCDLLINIFLISTDECWFRVTAKCTFSSHSESSSRRPVTSAWRRCWRSCCSCMQDTASCPTRPTSLRFVVVLCDWCGVISIIIIIIIIIKNILI